AVLESLDPGDEEDVAIADDAVLPARDVAGCIGGRLQALEGLRPEHALGDVLFARPYQLDWAAYLFGDERAFGGVITERTPAETAAHIALVKIHLLGRQSKRLRHRLARFIRSLTALPDLGPVAGVVDADHRVERLHLRVIAIVAAKLGAIRLRRRRESRSDVA